MAVRKLNRTRFWNLLNLLEKLLPILKVKEKLKKGLLNLKILTGSISFAGSY